jgi:thioredoxin
MIHNIKRNELMPRIKSLNKLLLLAVGLCLVLAPGYTLSADAETDFDNLPVAGMVTMIDLGAKKCIPCKMMAPILEKMEKKYEGKAAVVFIDVWENREQAQRFRVRSIPTQIFFDAEGNEIYRHAGFMDEKDIVKNMAKLGVTP